MKNLSDKFYDSVQDLITDDLEWVRNKKGEVLNAPCVFDIETSSWKNGDEKHATMYAWLFGINGRCIRGRTWNEFFEVINFLIDALDLSLKKKIIIYVHNLAFEFQWIKEFFSWHKVFAVEERRPLYAISDDGIEFRCSYLLSGLSLAKVGENLVKYQVRKRVGDLDYNLIRHSYTPLTDVEWGYILNDGLVMAYIQEEIERCGSILKIPLTKTGYVRNYCRERCLKGDDKFTYNKRIKSMKLTEEDYIQAKLTFAGGFTHANSKYVNKIMKNVESFDFTSSYPYVMLSEKFPMSRPFKYQPTSTADFVEKLKNYCCMFTARFYNITAKVSYENYISKSKCIECEQFILNNGRVVQASLLSINLTELDLYIIKDMYKWESVEILNFKYMYKGYLPKEMILAVLKLYQDKTTLKGVVGKEAEYQVAKGMLNSTYGMCVTDICRSEITYSDKWESKPADITEAINSYNKSNNRFLYYLWGVWITAYARSNLFSGINEFKNDYIYADTDSIKVINANNHIDYINSYNQTTQDKISRCLSYYNIPYEEATPKNKKGVTQLLGIWFYEGRYQKFKTLGAKRYMYLEDEKLHITIAGVSKKNGVDYLLWKYNNNTNEIFKNFDDSIIFPSEYFEDGVKKCASGKLTHTYLDDYDEGIVTDYLGVTANYTELSAVHLEPASYELSLDELFKKYLLHINDDMKR